MKKKCKGVFIIYNVNGIIRKDLPNVNYNLDQQFPTRVLWAITAV